MSSRESRDDSLASPWRARSLLTVRAAISSAVSSDFPSSSRESLMCSYCRARLLPFFTPRGGTVFAPSFASWSLPGCPGDQRPSCSSRSSSASSSSRSSASFASSTASRALSLSFPQPSCASPSSCFVLPSTRSLSMSSPSSDGGCSGATRATRFRHLGVPVGLELVDELSIPSWERVMDELQQDVRRAVTAVPQIFSDPTPARDTRGLPLGAPAFGAARYDADLTAGFDDCPLVLLERGDLLQPRGLGKLLDRQPLGAHVVLDRLAVLDDH